MKCSRISFPSLLKHRNNITFTPSTTPKTFKRFQISKTPSSDKNTTYEPPSLFPVARNANFKSPSSVIGTLDGGAVIAYSSQNTLYQVLPGPIGQFPWFESFEPFAGGGKSFDTLISANEAAINSPSALGTTPLNTVLVACMDKDGTSWVIREVFNTYEGRKVRNVAGGGTTETPENTTDAWEVRFNFIEDILSVRRNEIIVLETRWTQDQHSRVWRLFREDEWSPWKAKIIIGKGRSKTPLLYSATSLAYRADGSLLVCTGEGEPPYGQLLYSGDWRNGNGTWTRQYGIPLQDRVQSCFYAQSGQLVYATPNSVQKVQLINLPEGAKVPDDPPREEVLPLSPEVQLQGISKIAPLSTARDGNDFFLVADESADKVYLYQPGWKYSNGGG